MTNILVIAAHPDDEIIGCGGSIRRFINEGMTAYSLILSDGSTSRYDSVSPKVSEEIRIKLEKSQLADNVIGYKETFFHSYPDNSFDSVPLLSIIKTIEKYILQIKPAKIYTHHFGDLNIDHKLTFEAVQTATRPMYNYCVKEIYSFETLSATDWNFKKQDLFCPNYFVNIESTFNEKIKAMKFYDSELRTYPHPRSLEGLELSAKKWGTVSGLNYAEAFEIIRKII